MAKELRKWASYAVSLDGLREVMTLSRKRALSATPCRDATAEQGSRWASIQLTA